VDLDDDDKLIGVDITDGSKRYYVMFSDAGKVVRFAEKLVRATGRTARGVIGIRLAPGQLVISLVVAKPEGTIMTATEFGYGKRTEIDEYRITGRGGQGVISIQVTERNGRVVRAIQVSETDQVMLITDQGTLVRFKVNELSVIGRNTQGVRLINVTTGERLVGLQRIEEIQGSNEDFQDGNQDEDGVFDENVS
jgi:DNA gyrase subunit A